MHFTICFTFLHTFFFTFIQEQLWRLNNSIHSRWNVIYALPLFNNSERFFSLLASRRIVCGELKHENTLQSSFILFLLFSSTRSESSVVFFSRLRTTVYTQHQNSDLEWWLQYTGTSYNKNIAIKRQCERISPSTENMMTASNKHCEIIYREMRNCARDTRRIQFDSSWVFRTKLIKVCRFYCDIIYISLVVVKMNYVPTKSPLSVRILWRDILMCLRWLVNVMCVLTVAQW